MISEVVSYLGRRARDKVTGIEGIVTTVCFDLYGCAQAAVNPGKGPDGKLLEINWYDVQRLVLSPDPPVMPLPTFTARADDPAAYDRGPADKPAPRA